MTCKPLPTQRRAIATPAVLAMLLVAGCATTAAKPAIWPPPPDQGRIRFIRSFQKSGEIESGTLRKIWRFLVPAAPDSVIRQPIGIAISPDERRIYVANGPRGNVVRVDLATGDFDVTASASGHSPTRPTGAACDAEENLYVTDEATDLVMVFGRDGRFLREFGKGKLDEPRAIAIDRKGQLLYVLNGMSRGSTAHRVDVFSLKGEHLRTLGKRGFGPGEFNYPSALAVDSAGRILIADMLNFRVQILDTEGNSLGSFGRVGAGEPGTFDKAKGVATDAFGNIYVTDGQQGFVQIFNPRYEPLMAFGGRGLEPGFFSLPGAIAIDSRNHIYVGDTGTGKVSEYELFGTKAEDSIAPPAAPPPQPVPAPGAAPSSPTGEKAQNG